VPGISERQPAPLQPTPLEHGVWGILATPFDTDGGVDRTSLARQVELFARTGAQGVVALGVFGEAARLDPGERRIVARETLITAQQHDLSVVLGITTLEREETVEQSRSAAALAVEVSGEGALRPGGLLRGLMIQVPSAVPRELRDHLEAVHAATGAGVVVQDYPRASGVNIQADELAAAVAPLPFVVAVKAESTPTAPAVAALVAGCNAPVFGGLGGVGLIDELACGAAGAMTGFSYPEGLAATIAAFRSGGTDAARETWSHWLPLAVFEQQEGLALGIRKEVLRRRGILATAAVRPPATPFPRALEALLAGHMADADRRLHHAGH
jgi:4-hydroxy-tetrahydrodipicolinate synthase